MVSGGVQVLDKDIGLLVNEVVFLQSGSDVGSIDQGVVETLGSSLGFGDVVELEEAVSVLSFGGLVNVDYGLEDLVAHLLNQFVEVQLVVVFGEVAHVD